MCGCRTLALSQSLWHWSMFQGRIAVSLSLTLPRCDVMSHDICGFFSANIGLLSVQCVCSLYDSIKSKQIRISINIIIFIPLFSGLFVKSFSSKCRRVTPVLQVIKRFDCVDLQKMKEQSVFCSVINLNDDRFMFGVYDENTKDQRSKNSD